MVAGMSGHLRRTLGEEFKIETVLAGGIWRVSADANQLENALLNLAVNARDAMPSGGRLTIETANAHLDEAFAAVNGVLPGHYVMVAASDTGLGMRAKSARRPSRATPSSTTASSIPASSSSPSPSPMRCSRRS